jgi:hypothetical protein
MGADVNAEALASAVRWIDHDDAQLVIVRMELLRERHGGFFEAGPLKRAAMPSIVLNVNKECARLGLHRKSSLGNLTPGSPKGFVGGIMAEPLP